jgi:hypothetical protein
MLGSNLSWSRFSLNRATMRPGLGRMRVTIVSKKVVFLNSSWSAVTKCRYVT